MAAVVLLHIVNRTTLSRGIFKSPAVWFVSSVTLSCELSQTSKMLQERLNYSIPATTVCMNTVRIHTCYSNTDVLKKACKHDSRFFSETKIVIKAANILYCRKASFVSFRCCWGIICLLKTSHNFRESYVNAARWSARVYRKTDKYSLAITE